MARPAHFPAWLPLLVLLLAAGGATAQTCLTATFTGGRTFLKCNALPVLGASLHWTYHAENGTADIAFRAPSSTTGWVGWGINPTNTRMAGSNVFVASQDASGVVSVLTTILATTSPSLTNQSLSFAVPVPASAEYSGGAYTIYATVALPSNSSSQNTVWQAGPSNGGSILPHDLTGQNVLGMQNLDFLSGASTAASNSRLHRRNLHGVLNAVGWGILIPLGAMIARYLRVFEAADPAWFYLHITCQISGYALGVGGWGLGLKLGSESAGLTYNPHRNIGIAIFSLATAQVFALFMRPNPKHKYRVYWNVYHHSIGYSVIVLAIVNIFKGLNILKPATGWKTGYIVIIAILGGVALVLEAITWVIVLRRRKRNQSSGYGNGTNGTGLQL
ncbi:cytochrome b561 and DOMON domain-containing protein At5g47530-like [Lolium perenne]|uniref:cytochrome b561 and DOMON domain-containing protein At5g47530-like n=1 Tax=Lolium perenne TaxID=4522 RepID=UPI0021EA6250|nr:cytochrome b561 and DOMON domain-containing protein At5g47530-like [Lolium perenne]